MHRLTRFLFIGVLLLGLFFVLHTSAWADSGPSICDPDGVQSSGAIYRICMPAGQWNGDLVVFAHGYVSPFEPVAIPEDQLELPDGTSLVDMITSMGYAFAVTSYAYNGLAIPQGVADVVELVQIFSQTKGEPQTVYLSGPSEGGLVTVLGAEQHPDVFDGALSTCGPIGDFQKQINAFGDFRVVFDYFFPGVLPPSPIAIPDEVIANWDTVYKPAIEAAIASDPHATEQLLRVTRAAIDPDDPESVKKTVDWNLWYNVFATNDAAVKLGGQPYGNQRKLYFGSDDDVALNTGVERFVADPAAKLEVQAHYQTSGDLRVPLVTMHNLLDPIVPYWHESLYTRKALHSGPFMHLNIPIARYGHCNFTPEEVLAAFAILVYRTEGTLPNAAAALPNPQALARYQAILQEYGVPVGP